MSRSVKSFNHAWKFMKEDVQGACYPAYDDAHWRELDVPHDWSIEGPFLESNASGPRGGYAPAGIGWYRKSFQLADSTAGRRVVIRFDGIYMNSMVWINGHLLGSHPYGYTTLEYELTPFLRGAGESNVLVVRVDNAIQPSSRWYSGSGIYRHVWLIETSKIHVPMDGVFVTTPSVCNEEAEVVIETEVSNQGADQAHCQVRTQIRNSQGQLVQETVDIQQLSGGQSHTFQQSLTVSSPELWSPDSPMLYSVRTLISVDDHAHDELHTPFGIRSAVFHPDRGFILNGERIKLKGVCLHQDGGCLGVACSDYTWERQLKILKAMGCNSIRTSHNPPAPAFMEACDKLGMLVMVEAFDEWRIGKEPRVFTSKNLDETVRIPIYAYHRFFDDWAARDLKAMVRRDRNHPSVILWSIGNEISDTEFEYAAEIARELRRIVRESDTTRPVTLAMNNVPHTNLLGIPQELDVVGYNYKEKSYLTDHKTYPDRIILGSETRSAAPFVPRGDYAEFISQAGMSRNPLNLHENVEQLANSIGQFDFSTRRVDERFLQAEYSWSITNQLDYVAGLYLWTGFDYIGEPSPCIWPSKSSYFGVIDLCGFPKDAYYLYQSLWSGTPMVRLMPHWNWEGKEGELIPVWCFTNCETVELTLNGTSLGVKRLSEVADLHLSWEVPYAAGTLEATGRIGEAIVCQHQVSTAGTPAAIRLTSDRSELSAHRQDVAYVQVEIVDAQGHLVPEAGHLLTITLEGVGQIRGVDNGNPASLDTYQGNQVHAFHGLALIVIGSANQKGELTVVASAEGLLSTPISMTCV